MHKLGLSTLLSFFSACVIAQAPMPISSSGILQQLGKLKVLGSVLYIAAHPDDENTRLLSYFASEKMYRTGYLSLTRGDGGQNLIGEEQGMDLGLIRTQELLAARRIDGAEQFFTTAYDFGYSKNPEEALRIWGHEKILGDVVWVIRSFRPDILIARFPKTGEGGHGHHTASAILAEEAFEAAADPLRFPEQLALGVTVWQAKKLYWNTFNFGSTNTQREDQFKLDVGSYNPLIGQSYGEIAALSRSQHKSQGFGVPAQRGKQLEYFSVIRGEKPVTSLFDGVETTWQREGLDDIEKSIQQIIDRYDMKSPHRSVPGLLNLHQQLQEKPSGYWVNKKLLEVKQLIEQCSGLFLDATVDKAMHVPGDSIKIQFTVNNRTEIAIKNISVVSTFGIYEFKQPESNTTYNKQLVSLVDPKQPLTQPYWMETGHVNGSFLLNDFRKVGMAESRKETALFIVQFADNSTIRLEKPIQYKYTDPVKGELYQPMQVVSPLSVDASPRLILFKEGEKQAFKEIKFTVRANQSIQAPVILEASQDKKLSLVSDREMKLQKGESANLLFRIHAHEFLQSRTVIHSGISINGDSVKTARSLKKIAYDHIPDQYYSYPDSVVVLKLDLKTSGKLIGYIPGAGDKIPEALEQMGYRVEILGEKDIQVTSLKRFDAIVTGIRAYNIHEWLSGSQTVLMQYVLEGGVFLVQYNTNNNLGPVKAKLAPYPFTIGRQRVTDEHSVVRFINPEHPVLNYPNKITFDDFNGWVQERSIYHAEQIDSAYATPLGMFDAGEKEQVGSLLVADYGKGRFVYTGLALFRQLPAGVPGAYRLFANLIAKGKK